MLVTEFFSLPGGEWCWFFLPLHMGKMEDSFSPCLNIFQHAFTLPSLHWSSARCHNVTCKYVITRGPETWWWFVFCFLVSLKLFFPFLTRLHSIKWPVVYRVGIFVFSSCHFRQCVHSPLFHPVFILAALCLQISGSCFLVIADALIFLLLLRHYFPRGCKQYLGFLHTLKC